MRRIIILISLLCTLGITLKAQNVYSFREPDANEYLAILPSVLAGAEAEATPEDGYPIHTQRLHTTMLDELQWRYIGLLNVEPEVIYDIFIDIPNYLSGSSFEDREYLVEQMVLSLINNYEGDWSNINDAFSRDDLELVVTPRDFNADGQDELLVDVHSSFYNKYLVLQSGDDGYQIVPSPLFWTGCCFSYWYSRSGFMVEQYFGDMTGDDVPEWVIAYGGLGGNHMNHGWLYILQWQDGELVDLTPDLPGADETNEMIYSSGAGGGAPLFPNGVSIDIYNVDGNDTVEVVINQNFRDTWRCEFDQSRIFAWDGTGFSLDQLQRNYAESPYCALRTARDLTWQGLIEEAIPYYELALQGFELSPPTDTTDYEVSLWQSHHAYATVHLALIKAMFGDTEDALTLLNEIDIPEGITPIPELVEVTQETFSENQNAFDMCLSMYDVFERYYHNTTFPDPYWGHTLDVPAHYGGAGGAGAPLPDSSKAGCDIYSFVETVLAQETLNTGENPVQQLEAMEINVTEAVSFDLDEDSQDEWILSFGLPTAPVLVLIPQNESYIYSPLYMDYVNQHTEFSVISLPDGHGKALAQVYFDDESSPENRWQSNLWWQVCPDESDPELSSFGFVNLWGLNDNSFQRIQQEYICETATVDEIFNDDVPGTMTVWYVSEELTESGRQILQVTTLYWNNEERKFLYDSPLEVTDDTTIIEDNSSPYITELFAGREYQAVIAWQTPGPEPDSESDSGEDYYYRDYPQSEEMMVRYYRAMAYEALDRVDEALAEYSAIYDAEPDSAWGILASIHIEIVD